MTHPPETMQQRLVHLEAALMVARKAALLEAADLFKRTLDDFAHDEPGSCYDYDIVAGLLHAESELRHLARQDSILGMEQVAKAIDRQFRIAALPEWSRLVRALLGHEKI